jgi:hypothetical protein
MRITNSKILVRHVAYNTLLAGTGVVQALNSECGIFECVRSAMDLKISVRPGDYLVLPTECAIQISPDLYICRDEHVLAILDHPSELERMIEEAAQL